MIDLDEIRATAQGALEANHVARPIMLQRLCYQDVPTLCDEVERLREELARANRLADVACEIVAESND